MIMSNMIQPRGGNSNHDLSIAGTSNPRRGTQKSPLIMSNMIQTQDEISSTHDSPIAGSSNVFERGTKTHAETEWNSIQRVDEVSGIQHTRISDSLISPSSGLVSNKRGLDSIGLAVYGSGKSKLPSFSSRRGRESMGEDILSPSCGDDDDLFCGKFFKDKNEMSTKLRFTLAYSESVYPVGDKTYWDIPPHVASFVCRPPSTRFPSGRRKKKRIPSSWEYGKYRSISKPSPKAYKCSRCGQKGHNKGSCVRPI
ncbi:hypothetical protein YC2023_067163 [Brassica napus]